MISYKITAMKIATPIARLFAPSRRWLMGLAFMACCGLAQAQTGAKLRGPWRLDDGTSATIQDVYLAASGPQTVSAAWITTDGIAPGIYLRNRSALETWQPIIHIGGNVGDQPRDLAMIHDGAGQLHMVWTALDGGRRRLHYSRSDSPQAASAAVEITIEKDGAADAEFPAMADVPGLGITVVWQSDSSTGTLIRAAVLRDGVVARDLGIVSGASPSAIAPQIISSNPLRVAWYQIDEIGGRVAVNEWTGDKWRSASIASAAGKLPQTGFVVLRADADALAAGWQEVNAEGQGKIALEVIGRPKPEGAAEPPHHWQFDMPPGEHTQPSLDGSALGRVAIAWRNFTDSGQEICMRSVSGDGTQSDTYLLSTPNQRFAGRVDQVTVGDWSVAAWTDSKGDGGGGGVYVSELTWQTTDNK